MKKIIAIVLLLTLCLGLFAGCDQKPAEPTSNLANAKALLFSKYKPASKDEIPAKSSDFEVVTSILVDGVSYPVEWTVTVTTGAADAVKIVDGSSAAFKKIDLTEKPESEIKFTLTATIKDSEGNSETLTFNFMTPAFQAPTADKVVILNVKDAMYATGTEYEYTSSSGKTKLELPLSANKAEAIAFTMINNDDGTVTFKTDCGKFLYCDANSVEFVAEQSDYTKFVLEAADGGYMIKCAVANYNGNPQYLEIYSGYLTCYGLSATSNVDLYVFALEDATGAAGTVVELTPGQTPDDPENPDVPSQPAGEIETPVAGTAYKLALIHGGKGNAKMFFTGVPKANYPWYMMMTTNEAEAIDVFVEEVDGGLRLYFTIDGTKTYLDMHKDGTHYSLRLTTEPTAVYTWNTEYKTFVTMVDDKECFIGTSGTYDTFSCNKMEFIATSYVAHLYGEGGTVTPEQPAEKPATLAEQIAAANKLANKEFLPYESTITGTITDDPMASSKNEGYYKFTVSDGTNTLLCYFVRVEGGTPKKGDTVTVTGKLTAYNGAAQFEETSSVATLLAVPGTLAEQIAEANKLANKEFLPYQSTITGTITDDPMASSKNAGYYKFTVSDGTNTLLCYFVRVEGGTPKKGDTVTVTGKLTAYNGSAQFEETSSVATLAGGTVTPEQPEEPEQPEQPESDADAVITFADAANRTVMTATQQVWVANGITVTNDQANSTSELKDYVAPVRFYAHTSLTIQYAGMKTIKITCNSESYATSLKESISGEGVTVTADGNVVTITFATAQDSFVIADLIKQVRVDKIEIYK